MCPILIEIRDEILGLNLKTDRRIKAFEKLVQKLRLQLGHEPTDVDLQRMGRTGLMRLVTNDAERNVAGRIARRI